MTVGEKITYFRNMKHYSVNKLANLAGISQSYLRDIELLNRNPTIEILTYICDALEISLETFFSETETPDPFDDALYQKISLLTPSLFAILSISFCFWGGIAFSLSYFVSASVSFFRISLGNSFFWLSVSPL